MWNMMEFGYALLDTAELLGSFFLMPLKDFPGFAGVLSGVLASFIPDNLTIGACLVGTGFIVVLEIKVLKFFLSIASYVLPI